MKEFIVSLNFVFKCNIIYIIMCCIFSLFKARKDNKKKIKNIIVKTPLYIESNSPIPLNYK